MDILFQNTITRLVITSFLVIALGFPGLSLADVPAVFSYTGQLSDSSGNPVNGTVNLTFTLYTDDDDDGICDDGGTVFLDPSGCNATWSETHASVNVVDGIFAVELGRVTSFGDIGFGNPKLLGLNVNSDGVMNPLVRMTSVPQALRAEATEGSSVDVSCPSGSIQDALDGGATTITIDGVCTEEVWIRRNNVTLKAEGNDIDGITGPGGSFLTVVARGAQGVSIEGLTIERFAPEDGRPCIAVAGLNLVKGVEGGLYMLRVLNNM